MRKILSKTLAVFIIIGLSFVCAFTVYAAEVKVYSKDSSQGRVRGGGTLYADDDASVFAVGDRIVISDSDDCIYAVPADGFVFDEWENIPSDNHVRDGSVILARFKPTALEKVCNVTAVVDKDCSKLGKIIPGSKVKVLSDSEIRTAGSTVYIGKNSFTAVAAAGAVFAGWNGIPEDGFVCEDTKITAVFEPADNMVTVKVNVTDGGGGLLSTTDKTQISMPAGSRIDVRDNVLTFAGAESISALAYDEYVFKGWSGVPSEGRVKNDITISAEFMKKDVSGKTGKSEYSEAEGESFNTDLYYGTMKEPVNDGEWVLDNDGTWSYQWKVPMANAWGCLVNPYADKTQPQYGWFFFDRKGEMLTGWRVINNQWYYLEQISNGCKGQLYQNLTIPGNNVSK